MEKRRYALRLAYEGDAFRGFQRQPGMLTVEACLREALAHMGVQSPMAVAARTDAGVHALEQVVTFTVRQALEPALLRATINERTPAGLICFDAAPVDAHTHARASALTRIYAYLVGWPAPAELFRYAWTLPDVRAFRHCARPDLARARDALRPLVGEHDFGGFARQGAQTAKRATSPGATVRTLLRADILQAEGLPLAAFVLEGPGFLRAMVRNIVGTAVSASVGAVEPERSAEILAAPRARYRGVRAPGWGLTLVRVTYPKPLFG